jgi:predicted dehydrogenase
MKRLGIIGLGNQGLEHIKGSEHTDSVRIVAGYDPSPTATSYCQKHYPQIKIHQELDDLLSQETALDGIIIALPHHAYEEVLPKLFLKKLPILKEKPLARSVDEARDFISQAKHANCLLQTAIQRRTHPSYQKLKEQIADEKVSEIKLTMNLGFNRSDNHTWRDDKAKSGGGALLDCGYHMVDLALYLIGDFDLVSSTIFREDKPCHSSKIDDAFEITGRKGATWITIECRTFKDGDSECPEGYPKFEQTRVDCHDKIYTADRKGVEEYNKENQQQKNIYQCNKAWDIAMSQQLNDFAEQIDKKLSVNTATLWEQHPAQSIIQQAYQLAFNWHSGV